MLGIDQWQPREAQVGDVWEGAPEHLREATICVYGTRGTEGAREVAERLASLTENRGRFESEVRSAVRGLWAGVYDAWQFYDVMDHAIFGAYQMAWYEGAAECGFLPADLSPAERTRLQREISDALTRVLEFADAIEGGSKANGGKLAPLLSRAELWVNKYDGIRVLAQSMACGDAKFEWVLGPTEHCATCMKLAGKVKRASFWRDYVLPDNAPNDLLKCGGWRCQCNLVQTDAPLSRGRMPKLP